MRIYTLTILLIFFNHFTFGQVLDRKIETEKILNFFLQQDTISKITLDSPWNIKTYEFEGDYSKEKVYPNTPDNVIICTEPITFNTAIFKVLKVIDSSYDSTYYQQQIINSTETSWNSQHLSLRQKTRFIKWRWRKLYHETNIFSTPLFSKDGKVAIIKFGSMKRNSVIKKQDKIFILKKTNNDWTLVRTINSIKKW
jgi:hypothetical protein